MIFLRSDFFHRASATSNSLLPQLPFDWRPRLRNQKPTKSNWEVFIE
jgi:hypothetical protein